MFAKVQRFDNKIIKSIAKIQKPALNKIMIAASKAGTFGTIWWIICLLFIFWTKLKAVGINMIIAMCFSFLAGEVILKNIVRRVRPCHNLDEDERIVAAPRFYSFPSGHTTTSFAIVGVAMLRCGFKLIFPILLIAVLIGFSRIYLRVHYFSDVFVGMLLGLACGVCSVPVFNSIAAELFPMLAV